MINVRGRDHDGRGRPVDGAPPRASRASPSTSSFASGISAATNRTPAFCSPSRNAASRDSRSSLAITSVALCSRQRDDFRSLRRISVARHAHRRDNPPDPVAAPEMRFEFGTITVERSNVSISVARTLMRRT